jgi:hypothetical protein
MSRIKLPKKITFTLNAVDCSALEGLLCGMIDEPTRADHSQKAWAERVLSAIKKVEGVDEPIPVKDITDEHLEALWPVIGGTPHLFEHGKDELKQGLIEGYWDESGIKMDWWTMKCVLDKLRELGYRVDL